MDIIKKTIKPVDKEKLAIFAKNPAPTPRNVTLPPSPVLTVPAAKSFRPFNSENLGSYDTTELIKQVLRGAICPHSKLTVISDGGTE